MVAGVVISMGSSVVGGRGICRVVGGDQERQLVVMRDIAPLMMSYQPADPWIVSVQRDQCSANLCVHHGKMQSPQETRRGSSLGEPLTPLGAIPPKEHVDDAVHRANTA